MADNRRKTFLLILITGGVLLVLSVLVWNFLNQPTAPAIIPTPASVERVQRVSLEEAKAAYDAETAVFLDVREASSYNVSHIPGAVLIPEGDLIDRLNELDPSGWIITYCT
jgi:3-mercaptopyruvate sulfurtransferase SseA